MDSCWQDLPVELLIQILSLVDHRTVVIASGVCKGWRDSMRLGILELSFSWCNHNITELVQSVAPKFSRLQVCHLWNSRPYLKDPAVQALALNCHDLLELDLSKGTNITDDSLSALAHGCNKLEKLNLSGCTKISEQGVIYLAEHCKNLNSINLCSCSKAGTDQALLALARNCIGLQTLNLGWCDTITDLGVTGLASWCSDIRNIDLCGCLWITDQSVIALADKCHRLRVLGLYSCVQITDNAMYALANSSKYRMLSSPKRRSESSFTSSSGNSYSSNSSWSSNSLCTNSICSNNGSTLTYRDYSKRALRRQECYGLSSLNLGMCTYLSAPAVQAVCDAFPGLHTCAERHSLNISGCLSLISVHCACVSEARKERRQTLHI